MSFLDRWKQRVHQLKVDTYALYLAYQHPDVPWYAKVWLALVVGYAFSPIDLIPDFIPVLGYFDDLFLLPLGILLAIRLVPDTVMAECRLAARKWFREDRLHGRVGAVLIIALWSAAGLLLVLAIARWNI